MASAFLKKPIIAVDMDDVIADASTKLLLLYERQKGMKVEPTLLRGQKLEHIVPKEDTALIRNILHRPGFFEDLPVMTGAQDALKLLSEHAELFVASAATEFPNSLIEKHRWLAFHF